MSDLLYFFIILFVLVGVVAVFFAYKPVWTKENGRKGLIMSDKSVIDEKLGILQGNNCAEKKAGAFIFLMELSYVLVHTMVNQGNNYDDKKQTKDFCKSLTPQLLDSLNATEGKYE